MLNHKIQEFLELLCVWPKDVSTFMSELKGVTGTVRLYHSVDKEMELCSDE